MNYTKGAVALALVSGIFATVKILLQARASRQAAVDCWMGVYDEQGRLVTR